MAGAGLSKLQDIGAALNRFKGSDKIIIAVGDNYSQNQYYIAAYADQIYLHPMGRVGLMGYALYRKYIKSALEKGKPADGHPICRLEEESRGTALSHNCVRCPAKAYHE